MNKYIFLYIFLLFFQSAYTQTQDNTVSPGHYMLADQGEKKFFNVFENGRVSFVGSDYSQYLSGKYIKDGNRLKCQSDGDKKPLLLYYGQNSKVPRGKIRFSIDPESKTPEGYSLGFGKDRYNLQWLDLDSLRANAKNGEALPFFEIKNTGRDLIFKVDIAGSEAFTRYMSYSLPKEANYISIHIKGESDEGLFDFIELSPGETPNDIKMSVTFQNKSARLIYLGPTNDLEPGQEYTPQIDTVQNLTFLETSGDVIRQEEREIKKTNSAALTYYTNYKEALVIAQKENKFLRVYHFPTEKSECYTSLLNQIHSDIDFNRYLENTFNFLLSKYVLVILTGENIKSPEQLNINGNSLPAYQFYSPDGQLLHSGIKQCTDSYLDVFVPEDYMGSGAEKLYLDLLYTYEKKILNPVLIASDSPDQETLKKYLLNINHILDASGVYLYYKDNITDFNNGIYNPEFLVSKPDKTVELYLDKYLQTQMNAPLDTALASFIYRFYKSPVTIVKDENAAPLPYAAYYILKHLDVLEKDSDIPWLGLAMDFLPYGKEEVKTTADAVTTTGILKEAIRLAPNYKEPLLIALLSGIASWSSDTAMYNASMPLLAPFMDEICKKKLPLEDNGLANMLNNTAWMVYEYKTDDNYLRQALNWSKMALAFNAEEHTFLDTYAHLSYRLGDKKTAVEVQKSAFEFAKENEEDPMALMEIRLNLKLMEMGILGEEEKLIENN